MPKLIQPEAPNKNPDTSQSEIASILLDLLKKKPTWAQLNRIIKQKERKAADFSFQEAELSNFHYPGKEKELFTEDEKAILGLEAKVKTDETRISSLNKKIQETEKAAHQKGLDEGRRQGMEEGYANAKKEMDARINAMQEQVKKVIGELDHQKMQIFKQAEEEIVNLVLAVTDRIIDTEATTNPEIIKKVCQNALKHINETQKITIKVNPQDSGRVKDEIPLWMPVSNAFEKIDVEEDSRIQRGGCIIDTGVGCVDARLSVKMERMTDLIRKVWEESTTDQGEE